MAYAPFAEERIADGAIVRDSVGGPMFNTQVQRSMSGQEQRNVNWDIGLGKWELGQREVLQPQMDFILAFFRARKGKAIGFRFKDWSDFSVTAAQGTLQQLASPANTYQLQKTYTSPSGLLDVRKITKPVVNTVKVYAVGTVPPITASVDTTTGIVTLPSAPTGALSWTGEFDVPVRFETDELKSHFVAVDPATKQRIHQVFALPVIELRL